MHQNVNHSSLHDNFIPEKTELKGLASVYTIHQYTFNLMSAKKQGNQRVRTGIINGKHHRKVPGECHPTIHVHNTHTEKQTSDQMTSFGWMAFIDRRKSFDESSISS